MKKRQARKREEKTNEKMLSLETDVCMKYLKLLEKPNKHLNFPLNFKFYYLECFYNGEQIFTIAQVFEIKCFKPPKSIQFRWLHASNVLDFFSLTPSLNIGVSINLYYNKRDHKRDHNPEWSVFQENKYPLLPSWN